MRRDTPTSESSTRSWGRRRLRGLAGGSVILYAMLSACSTNEPRDEVVPGFPDPDEWRQGRYICLVCGESEYQTVSRGVVLERSNAEPRGKGAEELERFAAWYAEEIGEPHEHAWKGAGCHNPKGVGFFCTGFRSDDPWFVALPSLVDSSVAEHLLERMGSATPMGRHQLVESFTSSSREDACVWRTLGDPDITPEDRMACFKAWLDENPLWQ